jgi:hypothetical protein
MDLARALSIFDKMNHIALVEHTNQTMEHKDETS